MVVREVGKLLLRPGYALTAGGGLPQAEKRAIDPDNRPPFLRREMVSRLIPEIENRGYQFGTLSELLAP